MVEECNQGKGVLNYMLEAAALLQRYDVLMIEQREFQGFYARGDHTPFRPTRQPGEPRYRGRFLVMENALKDLKDELVIQTEEALTGIPGQSIWPFCRRSGPSVRCWDCWEWPRSWE